MAWIKVIEHEEADDLLKKAYTNVSTSRGEVANILKIHSVNPKVMLNHLGLYRTLLFGRSELTRIERETIAVAVSIANNCHY